MANLQALIEKREVCCCLRAKTMFYGPVGEAEAEVADSVQPLWCSRTQSLVGPDGELVGTDACRPGRACCEVI